MKTLDFKAINNMIEEHYCDPCRQAGDDYHGVVCRACRVDDVRYDIEALFGEEEGEENENKV